MSRRRLHIPSRIGLPLGALACAAATFLVSDRANAQLGAANVPLPNVMLLLDTSGSFEYMIDGKTPETAGEGGTCCVAGAVGCDVANGYPAGSGESTPNRWGVAVQALTGSILPYYQCASMNRSQQGFYNQYAISTGGGVKAPYDYQYYLPFHRPVSLDQSAGLPGFNCMMTPNALPGALAGGGVGAPLPSATSGTDCSGGPCTALDFPADAIGTYAYLNTGAYASPNSQTVNTLANQCTFSQAPNGALDGASALMRFGLMTFDNDPGPGIGSTYSVASPVPANTVASAFDGQWSYFNGWNLGPGGDTGWPAGCTTTPFFEVGARNPAAPPWEGRMIMFPNQSADTTATVENNQNVQLAIGAMRPYGATPLAGMLDDAEEYFWHDPAGPQVTDQFVQGGCRPQYIVILTDGQPNLDLGVTTTPATPGSCLGAGGKCPYQPAYVTAQNMYGNGSTGADAVTGRSGRSVTTYVIGFAVSQNISGPPGPTIANCSALAKSAGGYATYCPTALPTDAWYPCCQLQQIAAAGQGGNPAAQAYFADTPGDLNAALGAVLGQITKNLTSQTLPVYSPAVTYNTTAGPGSQGATATFLTSFNGATVPWTGDIQRQRIYCTAGVPTPQIVTPYSTTGDDFDWDVQQAVPSGRHFLAYKLPVTADPQGKDPGLTIRPYLPATPDGIAAFGNGGGSSEVGMSPAQITANFDFRTLNTTASSCEDPTLHTFLTPNGCAQVAMQFAMAQPTVSSGDLNFDTIFALTTSRCPAAGVCNPIGAILHSTPSLAPPPSAILRDDSYQAFATALSPSVLVPPNDRRPALYVATTDGLLHAFDTTTGPANNELWSFIPPGVFPNLISNYPSASSILLDGSPITKDVIWERDQGGTTAAWTSAWHTMLVAGFGAGGRGYYALDVTDPRPTFFSAVSNFAAFPPSLTGPHFQWQIASMNPPGGPYTQPELFGPIAATPAITTVYADPTTAGANPKEIGVAILPGGSPGSPYPAAPCSRELVAAAGSYAPATTYNNTDPAFGYRSFVRAWSKTCRGVGSNVPGRSVTIVRLDTGEILAVFARPVTSSPDLPTTLLATRAIAAPFDSPMTGTPIVYPSDVGAIAQQVFIGDADGTLWRLDLTDPNPQNWRAAMFSDSYTSVTDLYNLTDPNHLAYDSEAIAVNPIVTLDRGGNLTIQYATGDQQTYTANYTIPGQPSQLREEINFLYSLKLTSNGAGGAAQAAMNWFLPFRNGERVSGPVAVFDNTFYFATFVPPNPLIGSVCNGGTPKLWGLDFEVPVAGCGAGPVGWQGVSTGCGGNPRDFLPTGFQANPPDANGLPSVNVVIPGVSVAVTPSCTNISAATSDSYTGGMHTTSSGSTTGTYSLMAQIGGVNAHTGSTNTVSKPLLAPNASTLVDSWASLSE
jgi:type IV pilus assembly protein PilY1